MIFPENDMTMYWYTYYKKNFFSHIKINGIGKIIFNKNVYKILFQYIPQHKTKYL